ncbi:MAG: hypothetical protein IPK65_05310 [Gammaproteobacteria bacterium]|nr:hypothetical protein [Gammaproteobacteria bacterium]
MLPYPDRNNDGNYDGNSDCPAGAVANNMLLGRLAWLGQTAPCVAPLAGVGANVTDGTGERLWYAVSRNLLYQPGAGGYPAISPALLSTGANWLTVRDEFGNTISDRVAAVILAPGSALRGQNRAAAAPGAANYLDSVTLGATTYSNADFDGVFIAARRGDDFNDRLIYITADELVALAERRVVRETRQCLATYAAASGGKHPWAARLDPGAMPEYGGDFGETFGRIPATLNVDASAGTPDAVMQTAWPAGCFTPGSYWDNWRETVFYQVAPAFQPGGTAVCPVCADLNGSGGNRVIALGAGAELAGQARASAAEKGAPSNYLEGDNATPADLSFEGRTGDATFNDQVMCLGTAAACQ